MSVVYSTEDKMLGTGGAIKNAQRLLSSESGFYVVNGDILSSIELAKLAGDTHAIAAVQMRNPFGVISTIDDKDVSYVKEFLQKPVMDEIWINAGVYYFQRGIFDQLPEAGDFEAPVLPLLARQATLRAIKFDKSYYWRSIDSHLDLEEAAKEVSAFDLI